MLDAGEEQLLRARAVRWITSEPDLDLSDLGLQQITAAEGIDFATALLYEQVARSPLHAPFIAEIDKLRDDSGRVQPIGDMLLAIAPGAFYLEYPNSGADGRLLGEQAARLNLQSQVIPTASMGGVAENGRIICDWLRTRSERKIVLASVSKGGSDIKAALQQPDAAEAFANVVAWISLCGILDGSPTVDWLLKRKLREMFYRAVFWMRGLRFGVLSDLRRSEGGPLDSPLLLPRHIGLLQIVGFPLKNHLTNRLAGMCHARCASRGPNDGAVLLSDVVDKPGLIYPIWGADHYLRPSWELRSLGTAVLRYAIKDSSTSKRIH